VSALGDEVRTRLRAAADPERAAGMAAYMRSAETGNLPFLGVRRPEVRRIVRAAAAERPADVAARVAEVRDLWDRAEFREERYAAQDLLGLRWSRGRLDLLDLHRHLAVTGAWWDHVDEVAHRVGDLAIAHPQEMAPVLRAWSRDPSMWLRRLAILGQLRRRDQVDLPLLADVIEANLEDREFFVRKAIGWALRDVSRYHPEWVRAFVAGHDLSPLSRREALRHLPAEPAPETAPDAP
jgi:3-methyladenine DNA glycosylase AlkD